MYDSLRRFAASRAALPPPRIPIRFLFSSARNVPFVHVEAHGASAIVSPPRRFGSLSATLGFVNNDDGSRSEIFMRAPRRRARERSYRACRNDVL